MLVPVQWRGLPTDACVDENAVGVCGPGEFWSSLSSVWHAAATDMTRPSLMMVNVQGGKMTACDGVWFQQTAGSSPGMQIPLAR